MNQNDKAITMKKEIQAVAHYKALRITKYYLIIALILSTLLTGYSGYPSSSFSILFVFLVLTPILSFTLKDYSSRNDNKFLKALTQDPPFYLNTLKKKFRYSKVQYTAETISFYFTMLLLFLWLYHLRSYEHINPLVLYQPVIIIISCIILRVFAGIIYKLNINYDLMHNKI
ncbi:MAG: hypothetical protein K0S76_2051 [Herbinix sp.]|nr:hypothetical protein [Herbinix sp.]